MYLYMTSPALSLCVGYEMSKERTLAQEVYARVNLRGSGGLGARERKCCVR